MNGFKIKKIKSLTLGEKMKGARNEKRITLSEISKNTKIQIEYLESLENGDYKKLPADVYVKGFLRSFAEYVGINEEYLIKSFNKEKSIQKNIQGNIKNEVRPANVNLFRISINPKWISIIFISLFFLGLLFYLYRNLNNFVSNPSLVVLNPETNTTINDSSVMVEGKTDIGNNLFINNQAVLVDDNGVFKEKVVLREGINVITVKSVNQFDKEITESVSVEARYNIQEIKTEENQTPAEDGAQDEKTEEIIQEGASVQGVELNETAPEGEVLGVDSETQIDIKETDKKKKKK
jgi:cytoskeletal protein RodZ